jgi:mannose/fructose/N-acetylgalactosamine-specific phosphotransferase system component IID
VLQYAITDAVTLGIAVLTILILLKSNIDTLWIIASAMVISLVASLLAMI